MKKRNYFILNSNMETFTNLRIIETKKNTLFVAKDIAKMLEYKDTINAIKRHIDKEDKITYKECEKDLIAEKYKKLQPQTILITKRGVICLVQNGKKYNKKFLMMLKDKYNIKYDIIKRLSKQEEYISYITKSFKGEEMIRQYGVFNRYKIDLYFPEYNLAIECDELCHKDRDREYEMTREKTIKEELCCVFIRFNPDSEKFCVFEVINKIFIHITKTRQ